MSGFKNGTFAVNAGDFGASLKYPAEANKVPSLRCRYRIVADPSNLDGLRRVQEAVALGYIWERPDQVGWSVATVEDMVKLAALLGNGAHLPRYPVVETWGRCVNLLSSVVRPKVTARGEEFKSANYTALRQEAVADFYQAVKRHPPEYRRLPAQYFELWA